MMFSLSSNWCSMRHEHGESLVEEALELGFEALELGYNMTEELAAGIRREVERGHIAISSVHAFSPVPLSAPRGYPELHLLASLDEDESAMAAILLRNSLRFASEMGAGAVVLHAGRIRLDALFGNLGTARLLEALEECGHDTAHSGYRKLLARALSRRRQRARRYFEKFCRTLAALLPEFERAGVTLCLENLPSIEAFPDEEEMLLLKERLGSAALGYWHDLGHGQIRSNLGLGEHVDVARAMLPVLRGIHIQDVKRYDDAHLAPGSGTIDFASLSFLNKSGIIKVFEPGAQVAPDELRRGLEYLRRRW